MTGSTCRRGVARFVVAVLCGASVSLAGAAEDQDPYNLSSDYPWQPIFGSTPTASGVGGSTYARHAVEGSMGAMAPFVWRGPDGSKPVPAGAVLAQVEMGVFECPDDRAAASAMRAHQMSYYKNLFRLGPNQRRLENVTAQANEGEPSIFGWAYSGPMRVSTPKPGSSESETVYLVRFDQMGVAFCDGRFICSAYVKNLGYWKDHVAATPQAAISLGKGAVAADARDARATVEAYLRSIANWMRDRKPPELRVKLVPPLGMPEETMLDFRANFERNEPFGIWVDVRQRQTVASTASAWVGASGQKVSLFLGRDLGGCYDRGDSPRRDFTLFHGARAGGTALQPFETPPGGRLFIDLRQGTEKPHQGDLVANRIDLPELSRRLWESVGPDGLGDMRFTIDAICYDDQGGKEIELAKDAREYRLTHVAELRGMGIPVDSRGVEVWSERLGPGKGLRRVAVFAEPALHGFLQREEGCPASILRDRQRRLEPGLPLLPGDQIHLGRHDSVRVRFLFDDPGMTWLITSNKEYLESENRQFGWVEIYPDARPGRKPSRYASLGIGTGTSVLGTLIYGLAAAEPTPAGEVLVAIATGVAGWALSEDVDRRMRGPVDWELLRCDVHSTFAVDVTEAGARFYVLSGGASVERLIRGGKAAVAEGEVLVMDGGKFAVQPFEFDSLPGHLRDGLGELESELREKQSPAVEHLVAESLRRPPKRVAEMDEATAVELLKRLGAEVIGSPGPITAST